VEVCDVVVVLWVVVELSGALDWGGRLDGELAPGVDDCGMLGDVCATAQTAESIRIAVIKKVFFIYVLLDFSAVF